MRGNEYIGYSLVFIFFVLPTGCAWYPVHVSHVTNISIRSDQDDCREGEYYVPRHGRDGVTPVRTIRVNFHFMNSLDGSRNLPEEAAVDFAVQLIKQANRKLIENQPMRLPPENRTPVLDPLIQYRIVEMKDGNPAIYFHYDDDHYYLIKKGQYQNNYSRTVIENFGLNLDSVLNVFVQVPPPDSLMPKKYGGLINGIALGNAIKISGPLTQEAEIWKYSGMFNHEVGHVLGLRHSWTGNQCEDTPAHANCWNYTQNGSVCDSLVSNNVMDSNASQSALTPCQIGIMQSHLTRENGLGRPFIDRDFCHRDSEEPFVVRDSLVWCMEKDVTTDIRIRKGGYLEISNRVSMAAGTGIYIERGGQLVLKDGATLDNACGYEWKGVFSRFRQ